MRDELKRIYQKVYRGEMSAECALREVSNLYGPDPKEERSSSSDTEISILSTVWKEKNINQTVDNHGAFSGTKKVIFVGNTDDDGLENLPDTSLVKISIDDAAPIEDEYIRVVNSVVSVCRQIIDDDQESSITVMLVILNNKTHYSMSGLAAVMRTMNKEADNICAKTIMLDGEYSGDGLLNILSHEAIESDEEVKYENGNRYSLEYENQSCEFSDLSVWRSDVEYIIAGGAGGIGQHLVSHISLLAPSARIHVIGRKAESDVSQYFSHENVHYYQTDVCDESSLERALSNGVLSDNKRYTVIFAAGVVDDGLIKNSTSEKLTKVLSPKVVGLANLDRLISRYDVGQFICFSSITGVFGNKGQVDYAAANAFIDAYVVNRAKLVAEGKKTGKSFSIAWPLWAEGGMGDSDRFRAFIQRETGIVALETGTGMRILEGVLNSDLVRPIVISGPLNEVKNKFFPSLCKDKPVSNGHLVNADNNSVRHTFLKIFSDVTKITIDDIQDSTTFEEVGIDSIVISELNDSLENVFSDVSKTLFYECKNVRDIVARLERDFPKELLIPKEFPRPLLDDLDRNNTDLGAEPNGQRYEYTKASDFKKPDISIKTENARSNPVSTNSLRSDDEAIAIVGLSGVYPQSSDLSEFWNKLERGEDLISEIPPVRWDLDSFYEKDVEKALSDGKSYSKWGGFLDGFADFDPLFFNISPKEAESMDPHERLFLQACWSAMEEAGYSKWYLKEKFHGNVGVYAGVTKNGFELYTERLSKIDKTLHLRTSYSSIPNRVSYLLDLNGPSVPVDTMCSSSLSAIHAACSSLRAGECRMAFAGGVNLYLHPDNYVQLCAPRMLSSDGNCKAFGRQANGFVPGEGVGVVLLKPLSEAEKDNDHIHGLILSSSINHGGKTTGYTVPNPSAQSSLIAEAIDKANISAKDISYIEAHGTGTNLGDPIEISGLTQAFSETTDKKQFCHIGSVKSNIGHLEGAAGIASLTKVLLQMKHDKLVPTLHTEELNSNIRFEDTPFVVCQTGSKWRQGQDDLPIAGISSFGAGGANAHIIVQAYKSVVESKAVDVGEIPFFFSAPRVEKLAAQVRRLIEFLKSSTASELDTSYTLITGREHHKCRLSVVAKSTNDLIDKLARYLDGKSNQDVFYGEVPHKSLDESKADFSDDKICIRGDEDVNGVYEISKRWVSGDFIDRDRVYKALSPRRISLPTYDFDRHRYWVAEKLESKPLTQKKAQADFADSKEGQFVTKVEPTDAIVADHVLGGDPILPGAAQLQLMVNGARTFLGVDSFKRVDVVDMVFLAPIVIHESRELVVTLAVQDGGHISANIEILMDDEVTRYSQAILYVDSEDDAQALDILSSPKKSHKNQRISGDSVYTLFSSLQMKYGNQYQVIDHLDKNTSATGKNISAAVLVGKDLKGSETITSDLVNPFILDGALQSTIGLELFDGKANDEIYVPFAIEKFSVFKSFPSKVRVYAIKRDDNQQAKTSKIDLVICDDNNSVIAEIVGYSYRHLFQEDTKLRIFEPHLIPVSQLDKPPENDLDIVCFIGSYDFWTDTDVSRKFLPGDARYIFIGDKTSSYEELCAQIIAFLQVLQQECTLEHVKIRVVISSDDTISQGVIGIFKSLSQETPKILSDFVLVDGALPTKEYILSGTCLAFKAMATRVMKDAKWLENTYKNTLNHSFENEKQVTGAGCWVISGGAGALGVASARCILNEFNESSVALLGLSKGPRQIDEFIQLKKDFPDKVRYFSTDITSRDPLEKTLDLVRSQCSEICGVIHAAGVLKDSYLLKQNESSLRDVLSPKVLGQNFLDELTKDDPIEIFVSYSSLASEFGNAGQSAYAAANGYLDQYSIDRNEKTKKGIRSGRSVSINWPYWERGGMTIDSDAEKRLHDEFGMNPLPNELGQEALILAIRSNKSRIIPVYGNKKSERYLNNLGARHSEVNEIKTIRKANNYDSGLSIESVQSYLADALSSVLRLPPDEIDIEAPLENYGIDSILITTLTNELEKEFGRLSKTLFFEYLTLEELSQYFYENHFDKLRDLICGLSQNDSSESGSLNIDPLRVDSHEKDSGYSTLSMEPGVISSGDTGSNVETVNHKKDSLRKDTEINDGKFEENDVAIIGLAGRYPQSDDLDQFWENLENGNDCITEIPEGRWNHETYFDPEKGKDGKTYTKWGGFISDVDRFDAGFFGIAPREAEIMDPQERLFLECVYHTMEDSGYTRDSLSTTNSSNGIPGNIGVFVGSMYEEYQLYAAQSQVLGDPFIVSGNPASIANRVSHFCNFHGPSITVDTMCSSALTAIHLACESILSGSCEAAFAGGVNVSIHPNKYLALGKGQFASSEGRCTSFGEGGDGYVPGEGVGAVLLKPLSKAIADNDRIYGVIKATSVNHGGKTNGYTVPNPKAQAQVISRAIAKSSVDPRNITYIEAHGTGTSLGDPIEIAGLTKAFRQQTNEKQFCAIGSAKSNIGHCESAAGIAGLTKVLLQMKYQTLVPSIHCDELNSNIDFEDSPFVVQKTKEGWAPTINGSPVPRIAGLSSFGAGGSNAHVIIQEYETQHEHFEHTEQQRFIPLSAKTKPSLARITEKLCSFLEEEPTTLLSDLSYTLCFGREHHQHRLGLVTSNVEELVASLKNYLKGDVADLVFSGSLKKSKSYLSSSRSDQGRPPSYEPTTEDVASAWVSSDAVGLTNLFVEGSARRIGLPLYEFDKERYWLPKPLPSNEINPGHLNKSFKEFSNVISDDRSNIGGNQIVVTEEWREFGTESDNGELSGIVVVMLLDVDDDTLPKTQIEEKHPKAQFVYLDINNMIELSNIDEQSIIRAISSVTQTYGAINTCVVVGECKAEGDKSYVKFVFHLIKAFSENYTSKDAPYLALIALASVPDDVIYGRSLVAFHRSLKMAVPAVKIGTYLVELDSPETISGQFEHVIVRSSLKYHEFIAFRNNVAFSPAVTESFVAPSEGSTIKPKGTYVLSGGAGGIGYMFAEYLAETYDANLILVGRTPLNSRIQQKLDALRKNGNESVYYTADISIKTDVESIERDIKKKFGHVDGVFHSAGIEPEGLFKEMTWDDFASVLTPKLQGTRNLDDVFSSYDLDFFCVFSSTSALLGDAGSVCYAYANRYLNEFSLDREQRRKNGNAVGKTISIGWPMWENGGMQAGRDKEMDFYLKSTGQIALSNQEGLASFETLLKSGLTSPYLFVGDTNKIRRFVDRIGKTDVSVPIARDETAEKPSSTVIGTSPPDGLLESSSLLGELKEITSRVLKLPISKVDEDENLTDFGFDSISLAELSDAINLQYSIDTSPAIFFSYQSLGEVTQYLLEEYSDNFGISKKIENISYELVDEPLISNSDIQHDYDNDTALDDSSLNKKELSPTEPIAVIGMSGRFPGSRNIDELWKVLTDGEDVLTSYKDKRQDWEDWLQKNEGIGIDDNALCFGAVPGIREFDPLFFEISPAEAKLLDPRQRLLLQESWRALEDAAYGPIQIQEDSIGMFVGVEQGDYQDLVGDSGDITANHDGVLAARLSYYLNLDGPALAVNTACSSGLVALHQACNSLRLGECGTAVVAAVNTLVTPRANIALRQSGMLSEKGKAYAFDQRADGMVPSEAVVAFVIKPLSKALRDKDPIHAVIEATGINYDGKTNGITAPNGKKQEQLLKNIYDKLPISPRDIDVFVTQTAGTKLGDSVEVNALIDLVNKDKSASQGRQLLYSTKPSIGHSFASSGLVSLVSLIKSMKEGVIPPTGQYSNPSEFVNWKKSTLNVCDKEVKWDANTQSRYGATSAFGMSGTNAHVVVSSLPSPTGRVSETIRPSLFVFSGKTKDALIANLENAKRHTKSLEAFNFHNYAYTLACARRHFDYRCAISASSISELEGYLALCLNEWEETNSIFLTNNSAKLSARTSLKTVANAYMNEISSQQDLSLYAELYVDGYISDLENLFDLPNVKRLHAPTYEFSRAEYWVGQSSSLEHNRDVSTTDSKFILDKSMDEGETFEFRLARLISDQLEVNDSPEFRSTPLRAYGFNSIQSLTIKHQLIEQGNIDVPLKVFGSGEKSVCDIAKEIRKRTDIDLVDSLNAGEDNILPVGNPPVFNDRTSNTFPFTDIQESYYVGRIVDKANPVGAHIYIEFLLSLPLDIRRLNAAWNQLTDRHPMLKMRVNDNGEQYISSPDRPYTIKTIDLTKKDNINREKFLSRVKEQMESTVYAGEANRFYDIKISLLDECKSILHFSIDELICDGRSIEILIKDLESLYLGDDLSELGYSFKEYSQSLGASNRVFKRDLEYWLDPAKVIPEAPKLKLANIVEDVSATGPFHTRLNQSFNEYVWNGIVSESIRLGVSETSLILASFTYFISEFCDKSDLSVLLTFGARMPFHKQVNEIVGPCVTTGLFRYFSSDRQFDDCVRDVHDQLGEVLDHMSMSAISLLREMKKNGHVSNDYIIPVVFTSMLNNSESVNGWWDGMFSEVLYSINQTPQVGLDCQVRRSKNGFEMSWDIDETIYDKDNLVYMFSLYRDFVVHYFGAEGIDYKAFSLSQFIRDSRLNIRQDSLECSATQYAMTDQQLTYAMARKNSIGSAGKSCKFYQEVMCLRIDVSLLKSVLIHLINSHSILRSVVNSDGTLTFNHAPADFEIPVRDVQGMTQDDLEKYSSEIAHDMLNSVTPLGEWPYFSIRVAHVNKTSSLLHICIDMVIADAPSIELLINQIIHGVGNGIDQLTLPSYDYRSYLDAVQDDLRRDASKSKRDYWKQKFASISRGPRLPVSDGLARNGSHKRIEKPVNNWHEFENKCIEKQCLVGDVLLASYLEVLSLFNQGNPFSVVVPMWGRPDLHPDINQVVGDFTNLAWVTRDGLEMPFLERVLSSKKQIQDDISQWPVSGISELRRLALRKNNGLVFPVVFTGGLPSIDLPSKEYSLRRSMSQTPEVALDCLSSKVGDDLLLAWDYNEGVFPSKLLSLMFDAYADLIGRLAIDDALWEKCDVITMDYRTAITKNLKTTIKTAFTV